MCGICGIYQSATRTLQPNSAAAHALVKKIERMNQRLLHRGPDAGNVVSLPQKGIALGHRRLSIVGLGKEGEQPLQSFLSAKRKRVLHLSYNGELYNFRSLQSELKINGFNVDTNSDTQVLAQWLAKELSCASVQKLKGMFAFAAFDDENGELSLVRDAMGQKPLYFAALKGAGFKRDLNEFENNWQHFSGDLVFASEAKAILENDDFDDVIDAEILDHTLRFGVARGLNRKDEMRTLYQNMWQVPPGAICRFRRREGRIEFKLERYFDVVKQAQHAQENPFQGSFLEAVNEVEKTLKQAVSRRLMADVSLGAFLSGGIDSALICAMMRQEKEDVQTFTIGFESDSWVATDESNDAAQIAKHLKTQHNCLKVSGKDALEIVPKLSSIYDFPFADASAIPTFLVSSFARDKVKVSLTGDGADELFGGYARYKWTRSMLTALAPLSKHQKTQLKYLTDKMAPFLDSAFFEKIRQRLPVGFSRRATSDTANKLSALFYLQNEDDAYRAFITQWEDEPLVQGQTPTLSSLRLPAGAPLEKRLMLLDLHSYLPDDILQKVDRASMAASLEARAPFLDVEVVQLALSLPVSYLISKNQNKKVLRTLLARHLPPEAIDAGKRGFGVPLDHWLRHELRDWAEDLLGEKSLRENGLNAPLIQRRWHEHLSGKRSFHYSLWNVLRVQDFLRTRRKI